MRYYAMTNEERAALDERGLVNAILEEALHTGIPIPIPAPTAAEQKRRVLKLINTPAHEEVWLVHSVGTYDTLAAGLAFRDREFAERVAEQALRVSKHYNTDLPHLQRGELAVRPVTIYPESVASISIPALELDEPDTKAFQELTKQCTEDYQECCATAYRQDRHQRIKDEYLKAAKGDATIARAFLEKAFPSDDWSDVVSE